MKLKFIYTALLSAMMLGATSCNEWLSVHPEQEIEDKELFTSETGFKEALSGVYSSMVSDQTYTKELLFGTMGVLAHEWDNFPAIYQDLTEYDYTKTSAQNLIAGIWASNYNSIANANNLLKHIHANRNLFSNDNYSIIKGEAIALRAMLHFDLLRCFGLTPAVDASKPAIPYCTDFTYRVFPQLTVGEVADKVLADLKEAEALLKNDPILTGKEITELVDNGYLMNRTMHLNYYAVKALQARVYMWTGKYAEALAAANEVLSSGKFQWTTQDNLRDGADKSMAYEQVFGLNNVNLSNVESSFFNEDYNSNSFSVKSATLLDYYSNETADLRYLFLFKNGTGGTTIDFRYPVKFTQSTSGDTFLQNKMPMLRIAELMLIKAEATQRGGGDGLAVINELRTIRNTVPLTADADFYVSLVKEYRRELLGEGQLFFLYKRLNRPVILGAEEYDPIALKAYTFPLPISETEVAQRQPNR